MVLVKALSEASKDPVKKKYNDPSGFGRIF